MRTSKPASDVPAPIRFAIVGMPRTGSTLLCYSLDSHPAIACWDDEIFQDSAYEGWHTSGLTPRQFLLDRVFKVKAVAAGFKYLADATEQAPQVWDTLADLNVKLLHCTRHTLDTVISLWLALENKNFIAGPYARQQVRIPPKDCRYWLERCDEKNRVIEEESAKRNLLRLEIDYDSLSAGREFDRVLSFLGMEVIPLKCDLKKQRTASRREALENWDELKETFRGTQWRALFE